MDKDPERANECSPSIAYAKVTRYENDGIGFAIVMSICV